MALVSAAYKRWLENEQRTDDITAIIIVFQDLAPEPEASRCRLAPVLLRLQKICPMSSTVLSAGPMQSIPQHLHPQAAILTSVTTAHPPMQRGCC